MSSTQAIENLINGYANSEDSSFLIPNVTEDFLAVRPSGNPISALGLVGMFDSKDLIADLRTNQNPQNWNLQGDSIRGFHFEWNL